MLFRHRPNLEGVIWTFSLKRCTPRIISDWLMPLVYWVKKYLTFSPANYMKLTYPRNPKTNIRGLLWKSYVSCSKPDANVHRCNKWNLWRDQAVEHLIISLLVWLWLVVNDRKFSAETVFFSHTNQPAVFLHEPATKRTGQPNRLNDNLIYNSRAHKFIRPQNTIFYHLIMF